MARGTLSYDHEVDLIDQIPRQPDGQLVTKPETVRTAIPGCPPNQIGDSGTNNNKGRQGCPLFSQNAEGLAEGIPYGAGRSKGRGVQDLRGQGRDAVINFPAHDLCLVSSVTTLERLRGKAEL